MDKMVERCMIIRNVLGMPDKDMDDLPDEPSKFHAALLSGIGS